MQNKKEIALTSLLMQAVLYSLLVSHSSSCSFMVAIGQFRPLYASNPRVPWLALQLIVNPEKSLLPKHQQRCSSSLEHQSKLVNNNKYIYIYIVEKRYVLVLTLKRYIGIKWNNTAHYKGYFASLSSDSLRDWRCPDCSRLNGDTKSGLVYEMCYAVMKWDV